MRSVFEQPNYQGQQVLLDAIQRDDLDALRPMVIAAALYEEDLGFLQDVCSRLSEHEDEIVRGNAILAFGHIARLFGEVSKPGIERVRGGLQDPSSYVRGQANAAASDLEHFLGIAVRPPDEKA
jgi:hypothetical protein